MRWDALLLTTALAICACSVATKPMPAPDKNTNWLRTCQSDDECGAALACTCGLCTTSCGEQRDCSLDDRRASCVPLSDPQLSAECDAPRGAVAICVPSCTRDADCRATGDDFRCAMGVCTRSQPPPDPPAESDAGNGARCGTETCAVTERCVAGECVSETVSDCNGEICPDSWSCVEGLCGRSILAGSHIPAAALVRDGRLYVAAYASSDMLGNRRRDAALIAVSLPAGDATLLVSDELHVEGLALDGTRAYWMSGTDDSAGARLMSMPQAGGTPTELTRGVKALSGLAVDSDYVYWIQLDTPGGAPKLARCRQAGCTAPEARMDLEANTSLLAVHNGRFYFPTMGGLWNAAVDATTAEKLADPAGSNRIPQLLLVDDSGVYWTWANGGEVGAAVYASRDPRELQLAFQAGAWNTNAFALDERALYWVHSNALGTNASLVQSDKIPGESRTLLTAAMLVRTRIAVDDAYIYLISAPAVPDQLTLLRIPRARININLIEGISAGTSKTSTPLSCGVDSGSDGAMI